MNLISPVNLKVAFLSCFALALPTLAAESKTDLRLDGTWRFRLDRDDAGVAQRWFEQELPDRITLPGSLPAQGIGDKPSLATKWIGGIQDPNWLRDPRYAKYTTPENFKFPFWLQPERHYIGAAWYQRDIEVPNDWQGKRVVLSLERPHWETRVWLDNKVIGANNALATPHDYDLGQLAPGKHTLTIRVDNRLVVDVGPDSHSVSDHTQGNWNGIVGKTRLRATPLVWIDEVQLIPDFSKNWLRGTVWIGNATGKSGHGKIEYGACFANNVRQSGKTGVSWGEGRRSEMLVLIPFGDGRWDEFSPSLFDCEVTIETSDGMTDTWRARTGVREFAARGTQFTVNGRPTFIRGTLDCCIYPKTGHPPTDVAEWKRVIGVAKAFGLNNIRFHSWCPPEAAFIAADELGFYLHVEASSWANTSSSLGDGKPVDRWIYEETDRILKYYGNHPSFVLMPYGNEPGGKHHAAFLAKWVSHYRAKDPRRLWTSGAGWPQIAENQWHSAPDPRVQAWGGGLKSRINARPPETTADYRDYVAKRTVPVVSHEIGQWCAYPNFDEIKKYTGYLKPRNFEIFRDLLQQHQMGDQAKKFLLASGKLQTLCYKEDIESALRTPGMGGFQLLDLHDFPGQGTALVGVLDPFWEEKGYVTIKEFSRFCNSTVPLARLSKRVFSTDEALTADLEVAHFGPQPLKGVWLTFEIRGEDGKAYRSGRLGARDVPVDNGVSLGSLNISLRGLPAPARYKLVVGLSGTKFENDWDLWIYHPKVEMPVPADVKIVDSLTDEALAALNAGGKVLLMIPPKHARNAAQDKVVMGFSSIFWNTAWTHRQPPTTLGILCDPKDPLFADFPTDYHTNWQWWYLITRAAPMILDDLPPALRPNVQVIDDWFTARRLGLVFEARLGQGRLLVTSMDLASGLETNLVARQMRASLLRYVASEKFKPAVTVTAQQVRGLFTSPIALKSPGVKAVTASSCEPGYEPESAFDGDPDTMWHTAWTDGKPGFPHELVVEFEQPLTLRGLTALPRQDNNRNGWIKDYACYVSDDGKNWGEPLAKGVFPNASQSHTIAFTRHRSARFFRLVAMSGHASGPYASLAELKISE